MFKTYEVGGLTYQYEEGKQPKGAIEVKLATNEVSTKAKAPANKARKTATK